MKKYKASLLYPFDERHTFLLPRQLENSDDHKTR